LVICGFSGRKHPNPYVSTLNLLENHRPTGSHCQTVTYSNLTSLIGYINNTVIQLPIYLYSRMRIDEQIINIIPKWIHVFIQDHGASIKHNKILYCLDIIFSRKGLPSIVFWFCNCCVPLALFTRTLVINIGLSFYMQCFVDSPFVPLYCLSFFDIRLLFTPLVYSNFSRRNRWFVDKVFYIRETN
jgi:hypothetical protein